MLMFNVLSILMKFKVLWEMQELLVFFMIKWNQILWKIVKLWKDWLLAPLTGEKRDSLSSKNLANRTLNGERKADPNWPVARETPEKLEKPPPDNGWRTSKPNLPSDFHDENVVFDLIFSIYQKINFFKIFLRISRILKIFFKISKL